MEEGGGAISENAVSQTWITTSLTSVFLKIDAIYQAKKIEMQALENSHLAPVSCKVS